MLQTKTCKSCGEAKFASEFSPHPTCKGGVQSRCRRCLAALGRKRPSVKGNASSDLAIALLVESHGTDIEDHKARIAELELTVAYLRAAVAELRGKGTQEKAMAVPDTGGARTLTLTDILG